MKNEEIATAIPVRCLCGAPIRCHRLSGGAPVRCRVLPCVRPHHRMAFMSNGLRMGGLTQGKTLHYAATYCESPSAAYAEPPSAVIVFLAEPPSAVGSYLV